MLRTELRFAYAQNKKARAEAITVLQRKTGWPRHVFSLEAQRMELVTSPRRPWTRDDDRTLAAALGELTVYEIAKLLRRSHASVKARAERLEMSTRVREGFCITDLAKIFGVPRYRIQEWIDKGLLGKAAQRPGAGIRVADEYVTGFILRNPELIDFRLADQIFIKGVLYGAA
jgi:hypothetical protein